MQTVYDALGGVAVVTELAVLTSLRVEEWPGLRRCLGSESVLRDNDLLIAYWTQVLGGAAQEWPVGQPRYPVAGRDLPTVAWELEACLTATLDEPVLDRFPRAAASFGAFVRWDVFEALDQLTPGPQLPSRAELPVWGWAGPEDAGSLARQDLHLERLREEASEVLRPTDPVTMRLQWKSSSRFAGLDRPFEPVVELVFSVHADEPDGGTFDFAVFREWEEPWEVDQMLNQLSDWVSYDTRFGWGQERP